MNNSEKAGDITYQIIGAAIEVHNIPSETTQCLRRSETTSDKNITPNFAPLRQKKYK